MREIDAGRAMTEVAPEGPPAPSSGHPQYQAEGDLGFERVVFISDGIFAIAGTLLAIDVRLPEIPPERVDADLPGAVLGLGPRFLVYALSFLIVGNFWMEHHRLFRHIRRYDFQLIWMNVALLLCVAFLPVPNNALSRYPGEEATVLFYAVCLLITGLWHVVLWGYASGYAGGQRRLVDPDLDPRTVRYITLRGVIPTVTAGLAAVLAPFAPGAAMALLVLLFVAAVPLGQLYFLALQRVTGAQV